MAPGGHPRCVGCLLAVVNLTCQPAETSLLLTFSPALPNTQPPPLLHLHPLSRAPSAGSHAAPARDAPPGSPPGSPVRWRACPASPPRTDRSAPHAPAGTLRYRAAPC